MNETIGAPRVRFYYAIGDTPPRLNGASKKAHRIIDTLQMAMFAQQKRKYLAIELEVRTSAYLTAPVA